MKRQQLKAHLNKMGYKLVNPRDELACSYDSFYYDVETSNNQLNKITCVRIISEKGANDFAVVEVNSINKSRDKLTWDINDFLMMDAINATLVVAEYGQSYIDYLKEKYNEVHQEENKWN